MAAPEEVPEIIQRYKSEAGAFKKAVRDIVFYMKGGITWNEVWNMSIPDIVAVKEEMKEQVEAMKEQQRQRR